MHCHKTPADEEAKPEEKEVPKKEEEEVDKKAPATEQESD